MLCNNCKFDGIPLLKNVAPHIGAYCPFCGKYIKWLSKSEVKMYTDDKFQGKSIKQVKLEVNRLYGKVATDNDTLDDLTDSEVPW